MDHEWLISRENDPELWTSPSLPHASSTKGCEKAHQAVLSVSVVWILEMNSYVYFSLFYLAARFLWTLKNEQIQSTPVLVVRKYPIVAFALAKSTIMGYYLLKDTKLRVEEFLSAILKI